MPVAVFVVGCAFSTERFSLGTFGNMIVVSIGVAIASYGAVSCHNDCMVWVFSRVI
jgi:hypothetical protein